MISVKRKNVSKQIICVLEERIEGQRIDTVKFTIPTQTLGGNFPRGVWVGIVNLTREKTIQDITKKLTTCRKSKIIRILHECQVWIDKSVLRVTVWHHEAHRVMPNCDPRDRFVYPYLTQMKDTFSCTP